MNFKWLLVVYQAVLKVSFFNDFQVEVRTSCAREKLAKEILHPAEKVVVWVLIIINTYCAFAWKCSSVEHFNCVYDTIGCNMSCLERTVIILWAWQLKAVSFGGRKSSLFFICRVPTPRRKSLIVLSFFFFQKHRDSGNQIMAWKDKKIWRYIPWKF